MKKAIKAIAFALTLVAGATLNAGSSLAAMNCAGMFDKTQKMISSKSGMKASKRVKYTRDALMGYDKCMAGEEDIAKVIIKQIYQSLGGTYQE